MFRNQGWESLLAPNVDDIVKMPKICELVPVEVHCSTETWTQVEGWGHLPISKILTQNCSCLKETRGQQMEQE